MGVHGQLGLEGNDWRRPSEIDRTYIEDMKESVEVHPPSPDRFFVILCVDKSREWIPSTLLGNFFPDLCHGSAIETGKRIAHDMHLWINLLR